MKLIRPQWHALSVLCANFAEVFLATLVIPFVLSGFERIGVFVLLLGLVLTGVFSYLTLYCSKREM